MPRIKQKHVLQTNKNATDKGILYSGIFFSYENEILLFVTAEMDLEDIILSEIS